MDRHQPSLFLSFLALPFRTLRSSKNVFFSLLLSFIFVFCAGCQESQYVVSGLNEREANEIIVFLSSKGVDAKKIQAPSTEGVGGAPTVLWNISVPAEKTVEAMALLNQNGFPRIKGTSLLDLFAKQGLMTSDKEETIRYQAGLQEELKNIIRKIDGILDADVQISFPPTEILPTPGVEQPKIKAAVYVKHQGILNDPNSHLETKIKRLVAGSIEGLDFDNVSVISDRSRLASIELEPTQEIISSRQMEKDYVRIWSIEMTKSSAATFRMIFFSLIILVLAFGGFLGWLIYKYYPLLHKVKITKSIEEPPDSSESEKP